MSELQTIEIRYNELTDEKILIDLTKSLEDIVQQLVKQGFLETSSRGLALRDDGIKVFELFGYGVTIKICNNNTLKSIRISFDKERFMGELLIFYDNITNGISFDSFLKLIRTMYDKDNTVIDIFGDTWTNYGEDYIVTHFSNFVQVVVSNNPKEFTIEAMHELNF